MIQSTYHVFVQQDGKYGIALSQCGVIIRTATDFANVADTRVWIEHDKDLTDADNSLRERDPANPQAH